MLSEHVDVVVLSVRVSQSLQPGESSMKVGTAFVGNGIYKHIIYLMVLDDTTCYVIVDNGRLVRRWVHRHSPAVGKLFIEPSKFTKL